MRFVSLRYYCRRVIILGNFSCGIQHCDNRKQIVALIYTTQFSRHVVSHIVPCKSASGMPVSMFWYPQATMLLGKTNSFSLKETILWDINGALSRGFFKIAVLKSWLSTLNSYTIMFRQNCEEDIKGNVGRAKHNNPFGDVCKTQLEELVKFQPISNLVNRRQ